MTKITCYKGHEAYFEQWGDGEITYYDYIYAPSLNKAIINSEKLWIKNLNDEYTNEKVSNLWETKYKKGKQIKVEESQFNELVTNIETLNKLEKETKTLLSKLK